MDYIHDLKLDVKDKNKDWYAFKIGNNQYVSNDDCTILKILSRGDYIKFNLNNINYKLILKPSFRNSFVFQHGLVNLSEDRTISSKKELEEIVDEICGIKERNANIELLIVELKEIINIF